MCMCVYVCVCVCVYVCVCVCVFVLWTLSAMTSQNKNGGDNVGTLYRRSMDRLMICDVQQKEIRKNL